MRVRRVGRVSGACAALALLAGACSTSGGDAEQRDVAPQPHTVSLPDLHGQTVTVAAVWTGAEQKNFLKVAKEFEKRTGATVTFTPTGDNVSNFLGTRVAGGKPPDVAFLPQVGVLRQFAKSGWLKPLGPSSSRQVKKNFGRRWRELGAYHDRQYGVYFKVTNKSTVWYNTRVLRDQAGVKPPKTWKQFLRISDIVYQSGTPPVSIGAADGWVLTDWFENIYLSQAGPAMYDKLAAHTIPWTHPSVGKALRTLADLFGKKRLLAGGPKGALHTDFPGSVVDTFADPPKAGMVYEADFVTSNIANDTTATVGQDARFFPFPAVGSGKPPVVSGGDVAVKMKRSKGAEALLTFLSAPDSAAVWAQNGGYFSPNTALPLRAYPNAVARGIAGELLKAGDDFRFDMSDQAPAAFGGTKGAGEWKALQDFLKNPEDVAGAQKQLEADAAKAYRKGD